MKLIFDYRVLTHKTYTGVENYAKNILENLDINCSISKPKTLNKYLAHLWTHFILPFKSGNLLFCPANIAPIFVPKSKNLIITIHDTAFLTYPNSFSNFFRLYYKLIIPINIKRADKIITISISSKKEIERYYPNTIEKIEVIYHGFDKKFKNLDIKKEKQILYVGSMNERKNFIGVLKAFELLQNIKYKLLIVGNFNNNFAIDDKTKEILQKAKKNQNIEFRSDVSDEELVKVYNLASIFIFPSFYEGFGLPVLEAMACGTPVICSDSSSLPEVGGDAVVYCNPNSIDDIKEKIELVLNDTNLQQNMIAKGLERAKEFSWEKSAMEHQKLFEEVMTS